MSQLMIVMSPLLLPQSAGNAKVSSPRQRGSSKRIRGKVRRVGAVQAPPCPTTDVAVYWIPARAGMTGRCFPMFAFLLGNSFQASVLRAGNSTEPDLVGDHR